MARFIICIGLGGTGEETLKHLSSQGGVHLELAPLEGLVFDADSLFDLDPTHPATGSEQTCIRRVDLSIDPHQFKIFVNQADLGYSTLSPLFADQTWLPSAVLHNFRSVTGETVRSRPAGRLLLFFHCPKIYANIQAALHRLAQKSPPNASLDVVMVTSLCGGLGSSIFLDMAYIVRQILGDRPYRLIGYLTIAPEAYGGTTDMSAKTYAALRELTHYAHPESCFRATYPFSKHPPIDTTAAPFDYVYLVSDRATPNAQPKHWSEICRLIAQKISLRRSPQMGKAIVQKEEMLHQLQLTHNSVQHYLTFGLQTLTAPSIPERDRTLLKYDFLHFWLYGVESSDQDVSLLDRFLINWSSLSQPQNPIQAKLEASLSHGQQSFDASLRAWQNHLISQIEIRASRRDRQHFRENLEPLLSPMLSSVINSQYPDQCGVWIKCLNAIAPQIQAQMTTDILNFMEDLLDPLRSPFGFQVVRQWLEALLTRVNRWERDLEQDWLDAFRVGCDQNLMLFFCKAEAILIDF